MYRHISLEKGLPSSEEISNKLIAFERAIYPLARLYDWGAVKYQKKGIPVLCQDLVSMESAPQFRPLVTQIPRARIFKTYPIKKWKKKLKNLSTKDQWNTYKEKVTSYLDLLKKEENSHCLTKHFLESIARTAMLSGQYLENLESKKDQRNLQKFLKKYVNLQMIGLKTAHKLDQMAFAYQKEGIPILCQDIPPISFQ